MNFLTPEFGPAQVAKLTGISVESLREQRHRGLLDGFGEVQANGRWHYSVTDIITFAIARILGLMEIPIGQALWIGQSSVLSVLNQVRPSDEFSAFARRYVLAWPAKAGAPWIPTKGSDWQFLPTNEIADIAKVKAPGVVVVDTAHVAKALTPDLINLVLDGNAEAISE